MFSCSSYDPAFWLEIEAYVKSHYPEEAGGVITSSGFVPLENIAEDKANTFEIETSEYLKYEDDLIAFVHSHPDALNCPSKADMQQQYEMGVPWVIIALKEKDNASSPFAFGDQVEIPPLHNRPFRWGVTDCFTLGRDWYRLNRDVTLPNPPRDWQFWTDGTDMLGDMYKELGFKPIEREQVEPGDAFLAKLGKGPCTHTGIYVGGAGDTILHHPSWNRPYDIKRRSIEVPVGPYLPYIRSWLRYDP